MFSHDGASNPSRTAPRLRTSCGLSVTLVPLTTFGFRLSLLATIGRKGPSHVVGFFDSTARASTHEALVGAGVDQLALCRASLEPVALDATFFFAIETPVRNRGGWDC
jgi:hypothetical protein